MTQREKELAEQIEQLTHLVEELREQLVAAYAKLDAANARIAELEERINKNSQNSSKPLSTDGCQNFLNILVYTSTARKHPVNPFHTILLTVKGKPFIAWT